MSECKRCGRTYAEDKLFRDACVAGTCKKPHKQKADAIFDEPETIDVDGATYIDEPKARKPGRPRGKKPPKQSPKQRAMELGILVGAAFHGVATFRGEHWKLSDGEANDLGEALVAITPELPPKVAAQMAKAMPFARIVLVGQAILWPRIMMDMALVAEAREQRAEAMRAQQEQGIVFAPVNTASQAAAINFEIPNGKVPF